MYYFWHAIFAQGIQRALRNEQRIREKYREKELLIIQRRNYGEKNLF